MALGKGTLQDACPKGAAGMPCSLRHAPGPAASSLGTAAEPCSGCLGTGTSGNHERPNLRRIAIMLRAATLATRLTGLAWGPLPWLQHTARAEQLMDSYVGLRGRQPRLEIIHNGPWPGDLGSDGGASQDASATGARMVLGFSSPALRGKERCWGEV